MNSEDLKKLMARARRGRSKVPVDEPSFGFATRVAARWAGWKKETGSDALQAWERLARWGLAGALAVCLGVFAAGRPDAQTGEEPSAIEAFAGFVEEEDAF